MMPMEHRQLVAEKLLALVLTDLRVSREASKIILLGFVPLSARTVSFSKSSRDKAIGAVKADNGPGPGSYNTIKATDLKGASSPRYSLSARLNYEARDGRLGQTPGPDAYNVTAAAAKTLEVVTVQI
jgi:hypothetical protein